jgi:DHA1 family inner membrane transport protein
VNAGAPRAAGDPVRSARRALLAGNFAIGCGVMVAPGALNDLARSLSVTVAGAGQLITVAAVAMAVGAPLLAALLGTWDRRRLLVFALVWYAAGHALCALMPSLATLLPLRAATVLGAAVFTPQAAAAIGLLAPPEQRGRSIAFVFLGWSVASVLGLPVAGALAETAGWRWAFGAVAVLAALAALAVARALPRSLRAAPLTRASWRAALTNRWLMAIVAVTALSGAGQFTLYSYFTPYVKQVLLASTAAMSFLLFWFGAFGLAGNIAMARAVDRIGAGRGATLMLAAMALTMLLWPLASGVVALALVSVPWALAIFAANSAQQARLVSAAPAFAPALLALNTSAIYVGQALGAGGGGALLAAHGFGALSWTALGWMLVALGVSIAALRRERAGAIA